MNRILIIEDDLQICDVIRIYFQEEGMDCVFINDGKAAMEAIDNGLEQIGLVLLDIMLPNTDGFTICRALRKKYEFPILFLTARGREEDILSGYRLGCDDYIVKPFSLAQLHAKCTAFLRRAEGRVRSERLTVGEITIDSHNLQCWVNGKEIELPPKDFAILRFLMEHKNRVAERNTLLNQIWGYDYFGNDRVVDDHIRMLRKALGSAGKQIKTMIGSGYKLTD